MARIPYGAEADSPSARPAPQSQQESPWQPWAQVVPYGSGTQTGAPGVFDFSFSTYATPRLAKIIYILATIVAAAGWLSRGVASLASGIVAHNLNPSAGGVEITIGVVTLLLGWIPALLGLLLVRVLLEVALALIRGTETKITSSPEN